MRCVLGISQTELIDCGSFAGLLNLVDLAGSERLSKSGATGDRLKETQVRSHAPSAPKEKLLTI